MLQLTQDRASNSLLILLSFRFSSLSIQEKNSIKVKEEGCKSLFIVGQWDDCNWLLIVVTIPLPGGCSCCCY